MSKIRVLIVDDSVVIRKILSDVLSGDPDIEIAGVAANGRIALQKIPQTNPDVVTLDVEMPEMNGIETVKELRKTYPVLPVIMFSTLTERGAAATLDALTMGASDYVTKPANVGSVTTAQERIREQLIPKVKALAGGKTARSTPPAAASPSGAVPEKKAALPFKTAPVRQPSANGKIECVCIGVSTGGPNALLELIPTIPADFPVPIVIVQHMPPVFTKALADRLNSKSQIEVVEAADGMALEEGRAMIAPGGLHLVLRRDRTRVLAATNEDPPENSCRPAVDVLFRSVVDIYGARTLGVVLTGMGQDGLRGCEVIKDAGGDVFVQDEETSVVWGMPGFVANSGLADRVLPLHRLGTEIRSRVAPKRETVSSVPGREERA